MSSTRFTFLSERWFVAMYDDRGLARPDPCADAACRGSATHYHLDGETYTAAKQQEEA